MKNSVRIGVLGASGLIGGEVLKLLAERRFPATEVLALATEKSRGEMANFGDEELDILPLEEDIFQELDAAFFCCDATTSKNYAPLALKAGCLVIDSSPYWRLHPHCPLCLHELNEEALSFHEGLIASPGVLTSAMALCLAPLDDAYEVESVSATALLSASAAGRTGIQEMEKQIADLMNMREIECPTFHDQLAFNILPSFGEYTENEATENEANVSLEYAKIREEEIFPISLTALLVPLFYGGGLSLSLRTKKAVPAKEARALLSQADGIEVKDNPRASLYPTPLMASGENSLFVGRVRNASTEKNALSLWITFDNVRRAALNAVKIAESLFAGRSLIVPGTSSFLE